MMKDIDEHDLDDYRPLLFRLGDPAEREAWRAWRAAQTDPVRVHYTLDEQLCALIRCRNPKTGFTRHELERAIHQHAGGRAEDEIGVWVYYPWRNAAVRLLDAEDFVELRTSRNRYKITAEEQRRLAGKVVGIVGLSVGGQIAVTMAIERTCGQLRLADFDVLELSNLNRLREGVFALGMNKAVLAARGIAEIDPFLDVVCFTEGVTPANLDGFLQGGGRVDVLVEECDGLEMKLRCRQRARELGIPVVMEANDRGTLDIERFDREPDRPILHGLLEGVDLSRVAEMKTNEEKVPILMPMVGEATMSDKLRASLLEVGESLESWPQLASDVALGAALVTNVVRRILLDELGESGRTFVDLDQLVADRRAPPADPTSGLEARGSSVAPKMDSRADDAVSEPGQLTLDDATLNELLAAAALAPSGGNEQPWSWVTRGPTLAVALDKRFGDVLLSYREVARRLALGAAAENVVLRAHERGLRVKIVPGDGERTVATFRFFSADAERPGLEPRDRERAALAAHIGARHTNRRVVAGAPPLSIEDGDDLRRAVASVPGCELHLVGGASALDRLAEITARAERLRMLHPIGHRDLVREVRWTEEEARRTRDGIDLATLELKASEAAGLRMLRHPGVARLLRQWRRGHALEQLTRKAIRAASAVGLVTAAGLAPHDQFMAGRAIQRAWLTATQRGLAIQPHTAALYLFARAFGGGAAAFDADALAELTELKGRFDGVFGDRAAPLFLFRIFPACEPPARSLRRPIARL